MDDTRALGSDGDVMRRNGKQPRGMDYPDFAAAGSLIRSKIDATGLSIKAWCERHDIAYTTMVKILKGTFNGGQDCSLYTLWRIACALCPQDYDGQKVLVHQIMQRAGMLHPPDYMTITYPLHDIRRQLGFISKGVKHLQDLDERARRAALARLRQRDPGLDDEVTDLENEATA